MEPLPPVKEVEYRCIIGRGFDELSGVDYTTFAFETAKEFSSFRYEIAVRYKVTPGNLEFRVLGMTATRTMMPAFGTAKSTLKLPHLPLGQYNLLLIKSDGTENMFVIEFTKKGFQILAPVPRKRFIDVVIDPKAVLQGARITSTVSKTPPPPLIPRTIQKRQPPPPTPEELAILESLKSETPEERDAREERELFGGAKKVSKQDLVEAEQEAQKLAQQTGAPVAAPGAPVKKSTGKHTIDAGPLKIATPGMRAPATTPIEELQEVPEKVAHKPAPKPEAKHEAPKHEAPKHEATKAAPAKQPAAKPVAKHDAKLDAKLEAKHDAKHDAKHTAHAKPAEKPAAKPAAKPAPKPPTKLANATSKTGAAKTGHKTVSKQSPAKPAKAATPSKTGPAVKKGKVVEAKTGSQKTHKTTPAAAAKKAPAKKK